MGRCDGAMLPSLHRIVHRIVHRIASSSIASPHSIASSSIASPHRPSHRLIVHRIASSSIASPHRPSRRRNASVTLLGHHSFPHVLQCASKHLLLDNDVDDLDPTYLLKRKIYMYMLFEKIISLGYILQMVMKISGVSNHGTMYCLPMQCASRYTILAMKSLLAAILRSNSSSMCAHIV